MKEINTEPEFKAGDVVEVANCAPKCMFRGIKYRVASVRPKDHPICSFIPDNEDCEMCNRTSGCLAINANDAVLNSWIVQLEGVGREIDALYLKKAS